MNWRSLRFLIPLLIVCVALVTGIIVAAIFLHSTHPGKNAHETITAIPTPDSARSTYANTRFSYTIGYPTQWHILASSDKSQIRIFLTNNLAAPEAVAFDIHCFSNPHQLSAQAIWQQGLPQESSEIGIGSITFPNGIPAYVAKGQGQTLYTVYTLVKQQDACQIITYATDQNNAKVVTDVVNSFSWL